MKFNPDRCSSFLFGSLELFFSSFFYKISCLSLQTPKSGVYMVRVYKKLTPPYPPYFPPNPIFCTHTLLGWRYQRPGEKMVWEVRRECSEAARRAHDWRTSQTIFFARARIGGHNGLPITWYLAYITITYLTRCWPSLGGQLNHLGGLWTSKHFHSKFHFSPYVKIIAYGLTMTLPPPRRGSNPSHTLTTLPGESFIPSYTQWVWFTSKEQCFDLKFEAIASNSRQPWLPNNLSRPHSKFIH